MVCAGAYCSCSVCRRQYIIVATLNRTGDSVILHVVVYITQFDREISQKKPENLRA